MEVRTDFEDKQPIEENKLKELAEKFVTYFSGTFRCDLGYTVSSSSSSSSHIEYRSFSIIWILIIVIGYLSSLKFNVELFFYHPGMIFCSFTLFSNE